MKTLTTLATAAALATAVAGTAVQAEPVKTTVNDPFASTLVGGAGIVNGMLFVGAVAGIIAVASASGT